MLAVLGCEFRNAVEELRNLLKDSTGYKTSGQEDAREGQDLHLESLGVVTFGLME
jgi:hypothetical protein